MKTLFPYGLSKLFLKSVLIYSSIVLLCLFCSIGSKNITWCQYSKSEETSAQETYVSEVVLKAPWAEKCLYKWAGGEESPPGEFGHYVSPEAEGGPNSFTVAPNGDIYINDPLNKRIQRFSPGGALISVIPINAGFMCVDKDNHIYTTRTSRPHWFVDMYDQGGELLAIFPLYIQSTLEASVADIFCGNNGTIFVKLSYSHTEPDPTKRTIIHSAWKGICTLADASGEFSLDKQISSLLKDNYVCCSSASVEKNLFLIPDMGLPGGYGNLYFVMDNKDTVQVIRGIHGVPFGCDEDMNIFTKEIRTDFYADEYDERIHSPIVRKFNSQGILLADFRYWCEKPYIGIFKGDGFALVVGDHTYLDAKGNFYVFCQSHEDGIKVIKWSKAN